MTDRERDPAEWPLGPRVREARGRLSLATVANRAGLGVETVWQIENGRRRDSRPWSPAKPATILALARALSLDEAEALEMAGYRAADYITTAGAGGGSLMAPAALAEQVARLDPDVRRAIEVLVVAQLRARGYLADELVAVKSGGGEAAKSGVLSGPSEPARGTEHHEERTKD